MSSGLKRKVHKPAFMMVWGCVMAPLMLKGTFRFWNNILYVAIQISFSAGQCQATVSLILYQMKKKFRLTYVSVYTSITGIHVFKPVLMDRVYLDWKGRGQRCLGVLYISNDFASFSQLQVKFHLPQLHFYHYL